METSAVNQMPLAGEVPAEEARLGLAARIGDTIRSGYEHARNNLKTYAAIGTASLALSGAELTTATEPAAAENTPAASLRRPVINSYRMGVGTAVEVQDSGINYLDSATLSTDPNVPVTELTPEQKQECIDAALRPPKINASYIINPGDRPYEHNPTIPGPIQTTIVKATYQAMPEECANDFRRVGLARLKKEVGHNKWATLSYTPEWIYTRNIAGSTQITHMESGHGAPDWIYLKPGEQERLVLKNKVKYLPNGKVLDTQIKVRPIHIRWPKQ